MFKKRNIKIQFVICGKGDYLQVFKDMMHGMDNVIFPGWVDKEKTTILAYRSNAWLIPYVNKENFKLSLPNKTFDALYFGIPLLSSLEGEVKKLITENEIGMFYDREKTLDKCILELLCDSKLWAKMSSNSKDLYDRKFEFNKVYDGLVNHLEGMAIKK